jgi:hypothetical protein
MTDHEILRADALNAAEGTHRNFINGVSHPLFETGVSQAMEILIGIGQVMSGVGTLLVGGVAAYKVIMRARAKRALASPGAATRSCERRNDDETKSG